ncbi:MAG: ankyrin repeat domain-containing protein [Sphingobacteriia bacterium]|nr:ankyrin repeat domain-containing protein [Sphingobacteriia bacterium]
MASGNKDYIFQLNQAIAQGNFDKINSLLEDSISIKNLEKTFDETSVTFNLLQSKTLSDEKKAEILPKIIAKGADLDIKDKNNATVLHHILYEIENKRINNEDPGYLYSMIEEILKVKPKLQEGIDNTKMNPIAKAVEFGNLHAVEILLKHGSDPNSLLWGETQHNLLDEAIIGERTTLVNVILNNNKTITTVGNIVNYIKLNGDAKTPILNNLILKAGLKPDQNIYPQILNLVAQQNNLDILNPDPDKFFKKCSSRELGRILREFETKENKIDNSVLEKINEFIKFHQSNDMGLFKETRLQDTTYLQKYIESGFWLNLQDFDGYTIFMFAAKYGNLDKIKLLREAGANVNAQDRNNNTALLIAVDRGQNVEVINELIKAGANVDLQNYEGYSPLMVAAFKGNLEIVKELIKANADVNLKARSGDTALKIAAARGHSEIIKELVEAGAKANYNKFASKDMITLIEKEGKNKKIVENKIDIKVKKIVKEILKNTNNKTFDEILNENFVDKGKDNKEHKNFEHYLEKYIGKDYKAKIEPIYNKEKAYLAQDPKKVKLGLIDNIKSIFKGKDKVMFEKAVKEMEKDIKEGGDFKKTSNYKEVLKKKMEKLRNNNKQNGR